MVQKMGRQQHCLSLGIASLENVGKQPHQNVSLRFDPSGGTEASKVAPVAPAAAIQAVQQLDWPGEPNTVDGVMNTYNVECKTTGRWPGTTLMLVNAKNRTTGKIDQAVPSQQFKLFLVFLALVWQFLILQFLHVSAIETCSLLN